VHGESWITKTIEIFQDRQVTSLKIPRSNLAPDG